MQVAVDADVAPVGPKYPAAHIVPEHVDWHIMPEQVIVVPASETHVPAIVTLFHT